MHIAVCDDDSLELDRISMLLNAYRTERKSCFFYQTYTNATELLADMKHCAFDLLLLDILMPGFTGMEAAQELRCEDNLVNIIFLTSSPEFAVESYGVKARNYLLKPAIKETLFPALDLILAEETEPLLGFPIKTSTGAAHILYTKLVFVEVMNRRLYFHLSDGTSKEIFAPLSEYEGILLSQKGFLKVHRSYIVNLSQMGEITKSGFLTYRGETIPISRRLHSQVRETYMKHLFLKQGVK